MAHSSTSEPPVGQPPINSPDAVAGSSGCQGGPDEKEHSFNRTSKESGKCADALNVQAQIPSRDAAFPAEGSGHLCRLHESGVVNEPRCDMSNHNQSLYHTTLHILPLRLNKSLVKLLGISCSFSRLPSYMHYHTI